MCEMEIDEAEWNQLWGGASLRRLPDIGKLDWRSIAQLEVGEVVDVKLSEVPVKYYDLIYIAISVCPICYETVGEDSPRMNVAVSPTFTNMSNLAFGAWAHSKCVKTCPEIDDPKPIPW